MDNLKLRQFKIHNLAFAIGIASTLFVEQVVYANSNVADNNTSDSTQARAQNPLDAPLAYGFYDRNQLAQLPIEQRIHVPAACRGVWITPIAPTAKIPNESIDQSSTTARSDRAYYDPEVGSVLEGNVRVSQPGRLLTADKATLNLDKTVIHATGDVKIASPGLISYGRTGIYHLDTKTGSIKDSKYIAQERQAHGTAILYLRTRCGRLETEIKPVSA
jgi:lipopolysaccharide export system protein LptA